MLLKTHRKNQKQNKRDYKQKELPEWIARGLLVVQLKASKFLETKFEMLSIASQRLCVVAFCIMCFSGNVYLIIENFSRQPGKTISITAIKVPKQAAKSERNQVQPIGAITEGEFEKIAHFRKYLDSLDNSQQGKRIHDSITLSRPGFMDSLTTVEHIYQLQSLNK